MDRISENTYQIMERIIKMKKIILTALAAMLIMSVSACSSNGDSKENTSDNVQTSSEASAVQDNSEDESADESTEEDSTVNAAHAEDLKAVFEQVKNEVELPEEMSDFTAKRLERVLGISEDEIDDFAGGVCTDGVKQDQIIYVKAKDESKIADIQQKMQNNLDSIYNVIQNYDPKQKANIENAKVETKGLYVSLVISPDAEKIKGIFSSYTG